MRVLYLVTSITPLQKGDIVLKNPDKCYSFPCFGFKFEFYDISKVRNEDTGEESSYNLTGTEVCEEVSSETTDSSQIDFNCVITVATLEMGVNYAVNITPSVNGVEMGLFQHSFITGLFI